MKQMHIFLSGNVQGVGLRYKVKNLADKFGIVGFIKNLPDGRVEILAQDVKSNVDNVLQTIEDNFLISDIEVIEEKIKYNYSNFLIKS